MATLAEIRAKLKEQEAFSSGERKGGDTAVYPFWNLDDNKESTVRFLPDGDNSNTFFWVERLIIKLPFAGTKGEVNSKPITVQVPCMEMYGETCPILTEVRTWFKDKALEEMGRKYWKKRSYIFQGLVSEDGLREESPPENPIRRFIIGPQLFPLIKNALVDPEVEELPTDFYRGLDFKIAKTKKGNYADYSTSKWARRERQLSDTDIAAIEQHGLFSLKDFLPKKPTDIELKVIKEMFEASVNGEPYDPDAWGQYYKPAGGRRDSDDVVTPTASTPTPVRVAPAAPAVESTDSVSTPPWEGTPAPAATAAAAAPTGSRANDIMAMIRSRQTQS